MLPRIDVKRTGENIKRLRLERGMTVAELQEQLQLGSPQAVYKWQSGTTLPSVDSLVILAQILNVTMDEIIVVN